jgi:general secretion pathway protein G
VFSGRQCAAFTLIELLVVLAIVATLVSLSVPRYFQHLDRARETVLKENLRSVRDVLDKFKADTGRFPDSLAELVEKRYLHALPIDPLTESAHTWVVLPPTDDSKGAVFDIRSGAPGQSRDGTRYADW